jgi:hypothetical protein
MVLMVCPSVNPPAQIDVGEHPPAHP